MTKVERRYLELKRGNIQFQFWRLTEDEFRLVRSTSLPIKDDNWLLFNLMLSERNNPDRLTLPKALLTLEHFFGDSSDWFDESKSSFSFPLLLARRKQIEQFYYLLRIEDHRGSLEFRFYCVLENGADGYDTNTQREPFGAKFSREEINQFIYYLYGFLAGAAERICKLPVQPFLRHVGANLILYGYRDGAFFEEQFELPEQYEATIREFETAYGFLKQEKQVRKIKALIRSIVNEII